MEKERKDLAQELDSCLADSETVVANIQKDQSKKESQMRELENELIMIVREKNEKENTIQILTRENLNLQNKIKRDEVHLTREETWTAQISQLRSQIEEQENNRDQYKSDLEISTNYLLEVEERCQEA